MEKSGKILSILLIALLALSTILMTACSSSKDESKKTDKAKSESTATAEAEAAEDTGSSSGGSGGSSSGGGSSGSGGGSAPTEYCYVTIEGFCSNMAISLQGGDTVYSVTSRTGASLSGSSSYVTGINGRMEKSEGASSGWAYTLNGSQVWKAANGCSVSAGDNVCWSFVK